MNKLGCLIVVFFTCGVCKGQNLVPNPSFEDTASMFCGVFLPADFDSSIHYWYTPTNGTPDLYSTQINQSCWNYQPNSTYSGPICIKGSQMPRTGNVFAGLYCFSIQGLNQREYIQSPLTNSMVPGNLYYVEFYANLPDDQQYYTNQLGAYFSDQAVSASNDQPLPYSPQVAAIPYISNTAGWVKISGSFQAASACNYITIGNFYNDSNTPVISNPGGSSAPGCYGAYYFIDDVTVSDITAINEINHNIIVEVTPALFNDHLNIVSNVNVPFDFVMYDMVSRKILGQSFTHSTSINTEQLAKGIYLYEVRNKNGPDSYREIKKGKVVKD